MSNLIQKSTLLAQNEILGDNTAIAANTPGGLAHLLNLGQINIYSGTMPATADTANSGNTLLCSITLNGAGTGLTFDTNAPNGVMQMPASAVWKGTNAATGTASFWRYNSSLTDNNSATPTGTPGSATNAQYRLQGTCGTDATSSLLLTSTALVSSNVTQLNAVQFIIPCSASGG